MVSWTIPSAYIMEKMQMTIHSLTDPFRTANSYPSYLLIVLHKNKLTSTRGKKGRRLIVMTMTRSILKIISFVVSFINDTL